MQLNSEIWGTEEQQTVSFGGFNTTLYELYKSSLSTVDTIRNYKSTYWVNSPIDHSVNYWQIYDKSPFNRYVFIRKDGNNNHIYNYVKHTKPKSLFMVYRPTTYDNITFNLQSNTCPLWEEGLISSNYAYANYGDICTKFNYNRICARFWLTIYPKDENGNPTGSPVSTQNSNCSLYGFFHNAEDGVAVKDKYIITGLHMDLVAVSADGDGANPGNNRIGVVSSTPIQTPTPNYYYNNDDWIYYGMNSYIMGGSLSQSGGYGYQTGSYGESDRAPIYPCDPENHWELKNFTNANNQYIEYFTFTGTYEDLISQCATLGFWFNEELTSGTVTEFDLTMGENCTNDHMIMPIIENGITTGRYLRGAAAGRSDQAQWGTNWRDNVGYTGDKPYKNDASDRGDLTSVFHRASLEGSLNYYLFSSTELQNLIININTGYQPTTQEQFTVDFKGTNPADYIANVLYFPDGFVCPKMDSTFFTNVKIGAVTFTFPVGVEKANVEVGYYKEFAPLTVDPEYFSFMDYAPYTTISLYIPFCGSLDLDPAIYIGHTVTVRLYIDYLTGSCTGVVLRDGLAVDTISGSCGVTIPLTALATGSYQNAIKQAELAVKQAEIQRKSAWLGAIGAAGTLIGGVATGNPLAIAGGVVGVVGAANAIESANLRKESAVYTLDHTVPAVENVSAASPANAIGLDYDVHMLIKRPLYLTGYDEDAYSQTIAHACCIPGQLSQFSGLTVLNGLKLENISTENGLAATAVEVEAIRKAAEYGIYL